MITSGTLSFYQNTKSVKLIWLHYSSVEASFWLRTFTAQLGVFADFFQRLVRFSSYEAIVFKVAADVATSKLGEFTKELGLIKHILKGLHSLSCLVPFQVLH